MTSRAQDDPVVYVRAGDMYIMLSREFFFFFNRDGFVQCCWSARRVLPLMLSLRRLNDWRETAAQGGPCKSRLPTFDLSLKSTGK